MSHKHSQKSEDELSRVLEILTREAISEHGVLFASDHEFESVLREEYEETLYELSKFDDIFAKCWEGIKSNKNILDYTRQMEVVLSDAILEALQMLVVVKKYRKPHCNWSER